MVSWVATSAVTFSLRTTAQQLHHGVPGLGVELAGGLIGDEQGGVVGEGTGDGDPLLLAAGQLAGPLGGVVGEADEGQQQLDALLALAGVRAAQPQRDADVLGRAEDGDEAEGLEDEADAVAAQGEQALLVEAGEVEAVDIDPSPVGGVLAADDVEQGGLAGSRAPLEGDELAARDLEGDAPQGVHGGGGAVRLVHVLDAHHGVGDRLPHGCPPP